MTMYAVTFLEADVNGEYGVRLLDVDEQRSELSEREWVIGALLKDFPAVESSIDDAEDPGLWTIEDAARLVRQHGWRTAGEWSELTLWWGRQILAGVDGPDLSTDLPGLVVRIEEI